MSSWPPRPSGTDVREHLDAIVLSPRSDLLRYLESPRERR